MAAESSKSFQPQVKVIQVASHCLSGKKPTKKTFSHVFSFQWTPDETSSTPRPNIQTVLLQGDSGLSSWTAYGLESGSAVD